MNKRSGIGSFISDAGRPHIARSIKNEWRLACNEALQSGAAVCEIRTRQSVVAWKPGA